MIVNEDYKFRDDILTLGKETIPIEILVEQFKGIVYRYDQVSVSEDPNKDSAKLKFTYEIVDPADFDEKKLRTSKEFEYFLGLILNSLILDATEIEQHDTNNGESDSSESSD